MSTETASSVAAASPPLSWSKSLSARFTNPLSRRARNVVDFTIEPDDKYRVYRPGDTVTGHVVVTVPKALEITHIVCALHGWAQVYRYERTPGEVTSVPDAVINAKGSTEFEYHGNGLATLFRDEQVLCGSGLLTSSIFKFGFELQFPAISLPSTLDFERGAVNYVLTATVTRPAALYPATTETLKLNFKDRIDIRSTYTPKSRAISLEPVMRRGKVKRVKQTPSINSHSTATKTTLSRQNTSTSMQTRNSTTAVNNPPSSPVPSEDTVATSNSISASTHDGVAVDSGPPTRKSSPQDSEALSICTSASAHTITATTEIPKYGVLPGESLPIHVSVSHTKPARGIVIATLYRQCHVDMHPVLPLATSKGKNKKLEYEDIYLKSKSGLGHLYFTNTTPNMEFRKDLTQSSTMMIVDPQTLTADVRLSIKIPSEAFPNIDNVLRGMLSFTYHVEVIVDLTGKLSEAKLLPNFLTNGPTFTTASSAGNQLTSEWTGSILDTTPLRRTKSVATFEFPITVGTDDTTPRPQTHHAHAPHHGHAQQPSNNSQNSLGQTQQAWSESEWPNENYENYPYNGYYNYDYQGYDGQWWYDEHGNPIDPRWYAAEYGYYDYQAEGQPEPYVAPPRGEEHLDEKSRLRREAELLLPSQPPGVAESSASAAAVPSAPSAQEVQAEYAERPATRRSIPHSSSRASHRSFETVVGESSRPETRATVGSQAGQEPTEDKSELERRRLLAQASAPPVDATQPGPSNSQHAHPDAQPSAPIIDEDNDGQYVVQALQEEASENLPQYQR